MKKIAKISLVAAIAVAGFTTANAQPLEEAIKNVDVTGSVVYRYNDASVSDYSINGIPQNTANAPLDPNVANPSNSNNNYKVGLNLSSKVNDDVKFNSRFVVGQPSVVAGATLTNANSDFAQLRSDDNGDQNVDVQLSQAYFGYTGIKNTTVNVGKQGLTTPWTVAMQADGNEQTGSGILALSTVGPVTLAGAYFNQTNIDQSGDVRLGDGSEDVATIGAIVAVGPVTLDAWYLDLQDIFDTYTIGAKYTGELSGVKLGADARYVSLTQQDDRNPLTEEDSSLAKIVLTADAGLIDGKLGYAKTGDNGITALDRDANTALLGWNINSIGWAEADYVQAVLGIDLLSNLNLSANYGNIKEDLSIVNNPTPSEMTEIYAQLLYKMSKNLTTYVRYGQTEQEMTDATGANILNFEQNVGRLQVAYSF